MKKHFNSFVKITMKYNHTKVTFVGLGNMGYHMATNLVKSGNFKVSGFDLNKEVTEKFKNEGGEKYDSLEASLKDADALITMLPNPKSVNAVWEIAHNNAKKGTLLIDSSTISPIDTTELANKTKQKGFVAVDAPVSGGVMGANKATLSFMVGCEKQYYDKVANILKPMGKNFFHCGENSFGQVAKVCNNLVLGITMVGLSESLALGVKLGIDPKTLSDIMGVSSARCWSLDTYNPIPGVMPNVPASRDYENGFSMELITKDLQIAMDCMKNVNLDAELSKKTLEHYQTLKQKNPSKDFSWVYEYILNNKKI